MEDHQDMEFGRNRVFCGYQNVKVSKSRQRQSQRYSPERHSTPSVVVSNQYFSYHHTFSEEIVAVEGPIGGDMLLVSMCYYLAS